MSKLGRRLDPHALGAVEPIGKLGELAVGSACGVVETAFNALMSAIAALAAVCDAFAVDTLALGSAPATHA